jgi:CheY-like chemotaxis protein
MTRKLTLALSLFLLTFLPLSAEAGENKSLRLLGKTWCFKDAPTVLVCDYRFPLVAPKTRSQPAEATVKTFTLFGSQFCFQEPTSWKMCEAPPRLTDSQAGDSINKNGKVFELLGVDVCLGKVPASQGCDVRMQHKLESLQKNLWPVAFVAIQDDERRREVADALRKDGWAVVDSKTGYHLVESLSGFILGDRPWIHPHLVVVDVHSPGCSGITISQGLRDLGWNTPVILLSRQGITPIHNFDEEQTRIILDSNAPVSMIRTVAARYRDMERKEVQRHNETSPTDKSPTREPVYA